MEAEVRMMPLTREEGATPQAQACRRPLEGGTSPETDSRPEPQKEPALLTAPF